MREAAKNSKHKGPVYDLRLKAGPQRSEMTNQTVGGCSDRSRPQEGTRGEAVD